MIKHPAAACNSFDESHETLVLHGFFEKCSTTFFRPVQPIHTVSSMACWLRTTYWERVKVLGRRSRNGRSRQLVTVGYPRGTNATPASKGLVAVDR
jgi:hypothetical protein